LRVLAVLIHNCNNAQRCARVEPNKENSKTNKKLRELKITETKIINSILIIGFLGILGTQYIGSQRNNYLKSNYGFTVGKTIRYSGSDDGGNSYIEYRYYVNRMTYYNFVCDNYKKRSPLKKNFKVKYSKIKPEISEMYLTEEITDSAEIVKAGFKYITK
jgi:hypothetical protein